MIRTLLADIPVLSAENINMLKKGIVVSKKNINWSETKIKISKNELISLAVENDFLKNDYEQSEYAFAHAF